MPYILTKEECSGRVLEEAISGRSFGKYMGIIFNNGDEWKEVRRFTIRTLRDFGFGKRYTMEVVMRDELDILMRNMEKEAKTAGKVRVERLFSNSLLNVLWTMVAAKRFSHDDERMRKMLEAQDEMFRSMTFGADLADAFPILGRWFPKYTGVEIFDGFMKQMHVFFKV
jgi:methyl farnesoate epoxidase/farnesoate epoxidase